MKTLAALAIALLLALSPTASFAVNPSELLADPVLEARAEAIGSNLRCLVCQNESIEASDADLAHDLRVLVRERLKAGDTDDQARQYIVDRYGEFVLLQPVFALHTLILWLAAPGADRDRDSGAFHHGTPPEGHRGKRRRCTLGGGNRGAGAARRAA